MIRKKAARKESTISLETYFYWKRHVKLLRRLSIYFLASSILIIGVLIFMLTNKTFRAEFDGSTLLNNGIGFIFLILLFFMLLLYVLIIVQVSMLISHDHNMEIEPLHHYILWTAIMGLVLPCLAFIMAIKTLHNLESITKQKRQAPLDKFKKHFNTNNIHILFHWD